MPLKGDLKPKREYKDIEVKELGGELRIMQLSAGDSMKLREMQAGEKGVRASNVFVIRRALVDEDGKPLFKDDAKANEFLDQISLGTLKVISDTVVGFEKRPEPEEGKSEGSQPSSTDSA